MIEHFRKCIGTEATFYYEGGGNKFEGELVDFDDFFARVRGHNGRVVLLGMNSMCRVESDALQEEELQGTLPRPA